MDLIIVSSHLHKVREIRDILKKIPRFETYSLRDFPSFSLEPIPKELSFEEQAIFLATTTAKSLQRWTLADLLILYVPCLQPAPFNEETFMTEDRKKLLEEIKTLPGEQREAYLECHIALSSPEGVVKKVSRICLEGYIPLEERGGNGYGFDSVFVKLDYDKTFAELPDTLKARISVRNKALEKMLPTLEMLTTAHALLP